MENRSGFSYIRVAEDEATSEVMELPSEEDGTMMLSTIQGQFPGATGLRYKNEETQSWRGVRITENILHPPPEGWGTSLFYVVYPRSDAVKRKIDESPGHIQPEAKQVKRFDDDQPLGHLIVLGLPFSATEDDMTEYFSQYGSINFVEVKKDQMNGNSRGFGFVGFDDDEVAKKVLNRTHTILGRRCEVRLPRPKEDANIPYKIFVGRLPAGVADSDLRNYFEYFGELTDVYIPKPFRGFGFVTFASSESVKRVMQNNHVIKGARLNVTFAEPKENKVMMHNFQSMMDVLGGFSARAANSLYGGRGGKYSKGLYSWSSNKSDGNYGYGGPKWLDLP